MNREKLLPGMRCPKCKSSDLAIKSEMWVNYSDGRPYGTDEGDVEYAEPLPKGSRVCCDCQHTWEARE